MPVYNGERFLAQAVESILGQTHSRLELIVVDDASFDDTPAILERYRRQDARVLVVTNASNLGSTASRNIGCRASRGELIAVMDHDDVALPHRLKRQLQFLDATPDVSAVGAWVQCIDERGHAGRAYHYRTDPALLAWSMLFFSPIAHPTLMFRRESVDIAAVYREKYRLVEDYDLVFGLSCRGRVANVPEILVRYRTWPGNASKNPAMAQGAAMVLRDRLAEMGINVQPCDASNLLGLAIDDYPATEPELRFLADVLAEAHLHVQRRPHFTHDELRAVSADYALRLWQLAALSVRVSPVLSSALALQASLVHPTAIFPFVTKVFSRVTRRSIS